MAFFMPVGGDEPGMQGQHLITLKDRGVLKSSKIGTKIYYSLAVPQLLKVIDTLEDYSGRL